MWDLVTAKNLQELLAECWEIGQKPFTLVTIEVVEYVKTFVSMPKGGKF
jgi:hypothetical protein